MFKDLARKTGDVAAVARKFSQGIATKAKSGRWFKNHPASGYRNKYFVQKNFFHLAFIGLGGVPSGRDPTAGSWGRAFDGFEHRSYESIAAKLKKARSKKSLILEGEWLKLRAQVVDAEKYACECQLSELSLALEMARFGSLINDCPELVYQ